MKIADLLNSGRSTLSLEIFPPKQLPPSLFGDAEQQALFERTQAIVEDLAQDKPAFISVTCGAAGGSTGANTVRIASHVQRCGIPAIAHFTCLAMSRDRIADRISELRANGIENVFCLRGDYPPEIDGPTKASITACSGFRHAVDLVRALRPSCFCLGGACYPEGHPESGGIAEDIAYLKEKVDAGLDFLTTQMFFDNNVFFRYLSRLRNAGVTIPVIAGIMPVTNKRQISRICSLSGTYLPPRFRAIVDRFGGDSASMTDAGVAYATEQIIDLFANGVNNVHIYTMNKPAIAMRIMNNLKSVIACN